MAEKATMLMNQPYDEAVELTDDGLDESVDTHAQSASMSPGPTSAKAAPSGPLAIAPSGVNRPAIGAATGINQDEDSTDMRPSGAVSPGTLQNPGELGQASPTPGGGGNNPGLTGIPPKKNTYNPADFASLKVSPEIRELFDLIGRYKPHAVELDTKLKCFIPDFIPSIGEVDPFLKPHRPDGKDEDLGLKAIDEPSPQQSDPTVLDLQLRALSKKTGVDPVLVRSIEHADKTPKEIQKWISSIAELHKTKPPPQVQYAKPMPDVERLMQEWPASFEEILRDVPLPTANMDLTTAEYARIVCTLLDVPVYDNSPGSLTQALHLLFTLYNEFKSNQHFANMAGTTAATQGNSTADNGGFDDM